MAIEAAVSALQIAQTALSRGRGVVALDLEADGLGVRLQTVIVTFVPFR